MRRAIAISLTLLTCSAEANNLCSLNQANAEKTVKIQGVPGFFFKVHPDGDVISFIEAEHNTMIDLNTGKEYPTVGNIDPVWSPDGKFLTHPGGETESEEPQGLQFYGADEIIDATKKGTHKSVKAANSPLTGVYQSIGKNKDGSYNIVSDADGISLGKFNYSRGKGPELVGKIERPCPQAGLNTDLPMISKDGRFLSFYDRDSKSTKIYNIEKNCELAVDLGYGTGKVSFNADSSQIAFHVDQFTEFEDGYFSGVTKDKVKNVVVLNLEENDGKLKPSSWAMASTNTKPGDGGYYPDFDKKGNIYFMEDIDNNFQFVKVNPKNMEFRPMEGDLLFGKSHATNCEDSPTDILAKMWKDVCSKENALPMDQYREFTQAIDPVECKKMVESFYVPGLKVSKETLLKSCPQNALTKPHEIGAWNPDLKNQAEALLKGKCITCHRTPKTFETTETMYVMTGPTSGEDEEYTYKKRMPAITLDKMDKNLAYEMVEAIMTKKMPKKEPLSDSDRALILQYLQKKSLDMPEPQMTSDYLTVRRYSEENLEKERRNVLANNPNLSEENKALMISTIDCVYGQKNCGPYLDGALKVATIEAANLPEDQKQKHIDNKLMEARCMNLIEVTPQQCQDWALSKKPQK